MQSQTPIGLFTVVSLEKRPFSSMFSRASFGWFAIVKRDAHTLRFSQLEGETQWYCDAMFRGILPCYVHGDGSRSCAKSVARGELLTALDDKQRTIRSQSGENVTSHTPAEWMPGRA